MPPFLQHKRLVSTPPQSPPAGPPSKKSKLTDTLDTEPEAAPTFREIRDFALSGHESDSSIDDVDTNEFEDVSSQMKENGTHTQQHDEDEDIEWEDAIADGSPERVLPAMSSDNLQLTFSRDALEQQYCLGAAVSGAKKGPTRREREIRMLTHRMHVQFLLYHNAIRNNWICDKVVQDILIKQLPLGVRKEIEKWRIASGLDYFSEPVEATSQSGKNKNRGKSNIEDERNQRDWGKPSRRMEKGEPDLSRGDPIIPLMKVLSAYWKKRFVITAPGLRKRGYTTKIVLQQEVTSYHNNPNNPEEYGERIRNLDEFREVARACNGSRDVGAQLFTALLRGIGVESRMVASLQPSGFGFTKVEQAGPRKAVRAARDRHLDDEFEDELAKRLKAKAEKTTVKQAKRSSRSRGDKVSPIDLDASDVEQEISDEESVIDTTPAMPAQRLTKFDQDLPYPIYWTEAISPISYTVFPVSPLVLENPVATTPELISTFEPRGAKADKVKQVMAYVIAYSSDGTAKDVTTRYLKRRMWPGKTKGFRVPVEKIAIRNMHGKVKRYEEYDWFKNTIRGYLRTEKMRTALDDVEDSSDLVPQELKKKDAIGEGDTLQSLKASADWVLERFLRRDEALRPGSKPDHMFVSRKGEKLIEEPVYRRADIERCLTAESWHKDGRRPKAGVVPLKQVPIRAMTMTRKREVEEAQRQTGEIPTQGLYSFDQTEDIIPDPIKNGVIPKNAYGNIDCFVPTMVPEGAAHVPMRGTVRICKKLKIDYAEAVTGFEFGKRMAIPVITGVIVAKENEKAVRETWKVWDEEQRKKEEGKLEKTILALWRKFVMGLRINERVQEAYGDETNMQSHLGLSGMENDMGFTDTHTKLDGSQMGGGFLLPHEDEGDATELIMEYHEPAVSTTKQTRAAQGSTLMPLRSLGQTVMQSSLLQATPESSELSEISAGSHFVNSLACTSDVEADDLGNITLKRITRTRQTKPSEDQRLALLAKSRQSLCKKKGGTKTSPYFEAENEGIE